MRNIKFVFGVSFVFLSVFYPQISNAKEKLIKACHDGWPPFYYATSEYEAGGVVVSLLNEIAAETGYEIQYRLLPFKRCLKQVEEGEIDFIMATSNDGDNVLMGRTSLATWQVGAIVHQNYSQEQFFGLEDFSGEKVLLIQEYVYPEIIRKFAPNWIISDVGYFNSDDLDSIPHPFTMIENGQATVFFEDIVYSQKIITDNKLKLKVLKPAVAFENHYIGYALGREELYRKFENGLKERAEDGRLDQLYKDLLGQSWSEFGNKVGQNVKLF
ncbi:substrate-binding periplasmic protein [Kiloniella antarctica]|uniref:Substrate-binding periplasmic protein n=1 Tax=Kiloniella antarctica TaxID=1550907 RepID=A0ABW5BJB3_9PROT